jgi:hypothetical protein
MEVEKHGQADDQPDVKDEINATADSHKRREPTRVRRQPNEIKAGGGHQHGHGSDQRRAPVFSPGVGDDPEEKNS